MGFMKFDKKKAEEANKGFGLIEPGDYEFLITDAEYRTKNQKTPNINLTLVIRSDVEQDFKGRKMFHAFYISKDPEKVENSMNMIMAFLDYVGVEDGMDFDTPQEVAAYVKGKIVKGTVFTDEYNGKENSRIRYFNVSDLFGEEFNFEDASGNKGLAKAADKINKSGAKQDKPKKEENYTRVDDDPFANNGSIDISDDDLPF